MARELAKRAKKTHPKSIIWGREETVAKSIGKPTKFSLEKMVANNFSDSHCRPDDMCFRDLLRSLSLSLVSELVSNMLLTKRGRPPVMQGTFIFLMTQFINSGEIRISEVASTNSEDAGHLYRTFHCDVCSSERSIRRSGERRNPRDQNAKQCAGSFSGASFRDIC